MLAVEIHLETVEKPYIKVGPFGSVAILGFLDAFWRSFIREITHLALRPASWATIPSVLPLSTHKMQNNA
jgi:hypothetical protein